MKNYLTIICLGLSLIGSNTLFAQSYNAVSITPIMDETEFYIKQIENDYYKISKVEIDLVRSTSSTYTPVKLIANRTYNIYVIGERSKILDIDLRIHKYVNGQWEVVQYENNATSYLNTKFQPDVTDYFDFEVIGERFATDYSVARYSIIISF